MAIHNELGVKGENEAVKYLTQSGYRIVCRNWRFHGYEIDIVAETDDFIVFVEVKTRTTAFFGHPEDFVGRNRMRRMVDAADHYLIEYEIDIPARFDIIGLVWDGNKFELEHIEDAFMADVR